VRVNRPLSLDVDRVAAAFDLLKRHVGLGIEALGRRKLSSQ